MFKLNAKEINQNSLANLEHEILSISIFSPTKVVVLDNVDDLSSSMHTEVQKIIKKTPQGVHLIITTKQLRKNDSIRKLTSEENIVEFSELKGAELNAWIQKELKRAGVKGFDKDVPQHLIDLSDGSLDEAVRLIDHLLLYVSENQKLTSDDLYAVFVDKPNPNEFALVDSIISGQLANSIMLVRDLLARGKNQFVILGLLYKQFSNFLNIRSLKEKGESDSSVMELIGQKNDWAYNKQKTVALKYTKDQLKNNIDSILQADAKFKNRNLGEEAVFTDLFQALMPSK